jgi:hypothetical protein
MKTLKIILAAALLALAATGCVGRSGANARLTPDQMANLAQEGVYIAGGEQTGNGLWNGQTMQSALNSSKVSAPDAELIAAITFGEDVAPDAPTADSSAIEGKNALDQALKAFAASKSPQAAAAAAALGEASKIAANLTKPVPQGDRKGAQGVFVMRGDSADVKAYGDSLNTAIAAIRGKTVPRANAASTTTKTEKSEWTEPALQIVADAAVQISSNYWAFTLADKALDEKEVVEQPGDPQTPDPVPVDDKGTVASADRNGSQTFLWKPVSDSNGNLVVILPAKFNNLIDGPVKVNGTPGRFSAVANGNRSHWRFDKPGAAFGSNVVVTWTATGKTYSVTVPNGSARWSTDDVANPVIPAVPTPESELPKAEVPAGQGESPAP